MATADILFLAAEPRELTATLRFWQNVRPISLPVHWARQAMRKGRPVIAVANGAGPERARLAEKTVEYRALCNVGFCGALDPVLHVGDIVVSDAHLPVRSTRPYVSGPVASIDHIARTTAEKGSLHAQGAIAVEMESAGLAGLPFFCIKSVSDTAGETFANDFGAALLPDGRFSTARVLRSALHRPFARVPELIRMGRRAALVSRSLGEFLDSCEF